MADEARTEETGIRPGESAEDYTRRPSSGSSAGSGGSSATDDVTVVAAATRLVSQAASVLEKELAAGIAAARALEHRYVDVDPLRRRDADDVMQRFRRDAHEVVDLLMDLVQVAVRSAGGLAQRVVRITGNVGGPVAARSDQGIPTLESAELAVPGETTIVDMALENAGESSIDGVNFSASDLVAASGVRIGAANVQFAPAEVTIEPHSKARVRVSVSIPADAQPSVYSGMIVANKLEQVRAVLCIRVRSPTEPPG